MEADVPLDMLLDDLLLEDPVLPEEMEVPFEADELDELVELEEELVAPELVELPVLLGAVVAVLSFIELLLLAPDVVDENEPDLDEVEGVGAGVAVGLVFAAGESFLTSVPAAGLVLVLVLAADCCPDFPRLPAAAPITAPAKAPARIPEETDELRP
ncbi:hypothetical protein [Paenibacillus sp. RC67]|uniref:hypothetical protein n=1 Tax=Paenibacillus sp. RC67 TaxID=3039392 RepID=UPI0024AE51D5|nr:hypothetical protein [Paenibacillus sp. RC67]